MNKERVRKENSLVFKAGLLLALLTLTVAISANLAWAKGPVPSPPPISVSFYTTDNASPSLAPSDETSLRTLIRSIPQLYNSSWKPAIHDLASRSNQTLFGQWMDHIRLEVIQPFRPSEQYVFNVYFGINNNGSVSESLHHAYPVDSTLSQLLLKLHGADLQVSFSLSGPFLSPQGEDELFYFTDQYFRYLNSVGSDISDALTSRLGLGLSWFTIRMLDANAVGLDMGSNLEGSTTVYFVKGSTMITTTETVTEVSTESFTSTVLSTSTSTITQSPQTVTVTSTTISTLSNSNSAKLDYSANAVSGIVLGIIIALIGSIASVTISRKR